jgi:type VI secretion system secreted protein Hcp
MKTRLINRWFVPTLLLSCSLMMAAPSRASAAIKMFLALSGPSNLGSFNGNSTLKGFENQIEVLSFSWGVTNTPRQNAGPGGGPVAGRSSFSGLTIQKALDKASVPLYKACASGAHLTSGTLTVLIQGVLAPIPLMKIDLTTLWVTAVQASSVSGDMVPMESVTLNFSKIRWTYFTQSDKGAPTPGPVGGWDITIGRLVAMAEPVRSRTLWPKRIGA